LKGDAGDGVPNVLSDDDVLITEGARQTPMSKKKMTALMENPEALGTAVARRIMRNREMIDLSRTPTSLKTEILQEFSKPAKGNINKLMTVMVKNKMKLLLECLPDFEVRAN